MAFAFELLANKAKCLPIFFVPTYTSLHFQDNIVYNVHSIFLYKNMFTYLIKYNYLPTILFIN